MIRKGKLVKNTAIALAIISVFGSTLTPVSAMEANESITTLSEGGVDVISSATTIPSKTEEELNTKLLHETEDKDSSANKYLVSSKLVTENNKKYMVMIFNNTDGLLKKLIGMVNGVEVETSNEFSEDNKTLTVKFEVSSLENLKLSFTYYNPYFQKDHTVFARIQSELPESTTEEALDITLLHETEDKDSSANKYLVSSKLVTENNKKYIVMTFNNTDGLLKKLIGMVNGVEVETSNEFSEDNEILTVKFETSSLENLKLSFTYYNPYFQKDHTVFARIQVGTVTEETPEETPEVETTPDDNSDKEESTNEYENGYYQVNNIIDHSSETGKEMARKLLSEVTKMEVENGKVYLTFTMNEELAGFVKDISAKVDNNTVEIKKIDDNNFTIEVPNLDAKVQLSMYITMMGSSQVFDITFDKSTVKLLSSTENPSNGSNDSENNNSSSNESNNEGNNNSSSNNEEVKDEVVKGKLYTIKNEVVYDNEIGYNMVRQYLNETTKIEKIGEKTYATLTFTGVNLMQNHKVYVNGSVVEHTVVSKTSDSISIRFEISDINDDIQVQLFVVPMNKTVKFGVKLLEDTLTFVKEYTVENSQENTTSNETLPQTGSAFGSEMLLGFGGLLTASGALLRRKRK